MEDQDFFPVTIPTTISNVEQQIDVSDLIAKSATLGKLGTVLTLSAKYKELEKPGETMRGIFFGFCTIRIANKETGELEEKKAAQFLIDKQVFLNAGVVLVREIEQAAVTKGTPLEVLYEGKQNNTKIYRISLLG